jgi:hypothetical protein
MPFSSQQTLAQHGAGTQLLHPGNVSHLSFVFFSYAL